MNRILRRPAARRDLVGIFRYLAQQGSLEVADRFFARAEATIKRLAAMPGLGTIYEPEGPHVTEIRFATVDGFRKHLVFYRPIEGGLEILRVLHGARDLPGLLSDETTDNEGPPE